jgi:hypothetical protein
MQMIVRLVNYKLDDSKNIQHNLMHSKFKKIKFKIANKFKNVKYINKKKNLNQELYDKIF